MANRDPVSVGRYIPSIAELMNTCDTGLRIKCRTSSHFSTAIKINSATLLQGVALEISQHNMIQCDKLHTFPEGQLVDKSGKCIERKTKVSKKVWILFG